VISWPLKRVECFNRDGFRYFGRQPYFWPTLTYMVYVRAAEPMVRVLKMARGIHCCANSLLFLSFNQRLYIVTNINVYTYLTAQRLCMNCLPLLPNNTASKTYFTHIRRGAQC